MRVMTVEKNLRLFFHSRIYCRHQFEEKKKTVYPIHRHFWHSEACILCEENKQIFFRMQKCTIDWVVPIFLFFSFFWDHIFCVCKFKNDRPKPFLTHWCFFKEPSQRSSILRPIDNGFIIWFKWHLIVHRNF